MPKIPAHPESPSRLTTRELLQSHPSPGQRIPFTPPAKLKARPNLSRVSFPNKTTVLGEHVVYHCLLVHLQSDLPLFLPQALDDHLLEGRNMVVCQQSLDHLGEGK